MEYIVVSPAGERLTTVVAIRELFERGGDATAGKAALLWRLANQSLLGVRGRHPHPRRLQPSATLCNPTTEAAAPIIEGSNPERPGERRGERRVGGGLEGGARGGDDLGKNGSHARLPAPSCHASGHTLVPRTPLRRTCQSRTYMYMYVCARPQDLLVPLRLWMDVDLGIAVGAACSEAPSWRCSKLSAWLPGAGYLWRTYLGLAMLAAHLPGVAPLPGASYSGSCRATHAAAQGPMGGCGAAPRPGRSRRFRRLLHRPGARSLVPLHTRPAAVASGGACAGGPLTADHGRRR